jgi:hypothetical protein
MQTYEGDEGIALSNQCIYGSIALVDLGRLFSFLIYTPDGRTPWTGDQAVARPLPTHRTTQTQNKRTRISMPRVGFEPTFPAFDRTKRVGIALYRAIFYLPISLTFIA